MGAKGPRAKCAVEVCDRVTVGWKEYCEAHWHYFATTGKRPTHKIKPRGVPPIDRFMQRVTKTESCWIWTGRLNMHGYGSFALSTGKVVSAHRWGYQELVGPVADSLELDHLCRNRACVNPEHLEPVTRETNWIRGQALSAINARKTHCKRGHEFTPENTYRWRNSRICRTCRAQRQAVAS